MTTDITPVAPDEDPETMARRAASVIADTYRSGPLEADLVAMLTRATAPGTERTIVFRDLMAMLDSYFGDNDVSFAALELLGYGDATQYLDEVDDPDAQRTLRALFRRLSGIYGPEVSRSVEVFNRGIADWEYAEVRPILLERSRQWLVEIGVTTVGRENFELRCSPVSVLRLVNRLLDGLVGASTFSDDFVAMYDETSTTEFFERASALIDGNRAQLEREAGGAAPVFLVEAPSGEIDDIVAGVAAEGGQADVLTDDTAEIFPVVALLAIAVPAGLGILASVVNRIVHSWKDHGVMIDGRGEGPPIVRREDALPHGTVVILSRDGDQVERSALPDDRLADYVAAVLGSLSSGETASAASSAGDTSLG